MPRDSVYVEDTTDPSRQIQIPFGTPTGVLLANLSLTHGIPLDTIDLFLATLRHSSFNVNEITLQESSDIELRIEECMIQRRKSLMDRYGSCTVGIPHTILDYVVDALLSDTYPLALDVQSYKSNPSRRFGYLESRTFGAMTLVHLTWTDYARRGLWRRIIVDGEDTGTYPPISLSHYLRELAIVPHYSVKANVRMQSWNHITDVLCHAPYLRTLYVDVNHMRVPSEVYRAFFSQLGSHLSLEELWIMGETQRCQEDICAAVLRLQGLKSLVLERWDSDPHAHLPFGLNISTQRLESVAIMDPSNLNCAPCFLRPRNGYPVQNLSVALLNDRQAEMNALLVPHLDECLPFLKSLDITTSWNRYEPEHSYKRLNAVLSRAINLQQFTLIVADAVSTSRLDLPRTLTKLHIHHHLFPSLEFCPDPGDENIACIVESLCSSPSSSEMSRFERLVVSCENINGGKELETLYSKTWTTCQTLGIRISFEYRRSPGLESIVKWIENARG
ncbi:hypothetical protein DFH11DRAFT_737815 [Phellopilus nigrolimitatus]|nr:hypothetical protein DFH11DRAFT_737815 [Phellopilus nigrolimitatus]